MSKMISVASGFQYSVNIGYDLNNDDKLKNFIPTKSALMLLKDILSSTALDATERARVLVGAYGKGKSHIILTILSVLMQRDRSLFTHLMPKINEDPELKQLVDNYYSDKKNRILPVIINGTSGSLPQAFLLALQRTLDENGLDIMPETNYRAAINAIQKWKADYPKTYDKFKKEISLPVDAFISELNDYNAAIYSEFEEVYPKLTSGSIFNPFVGFDVVELYESVVKSLKQRGYLGIYVVYDEFSKFLESNITAASVSDTKMLQDFAEKCNRSSENELHLLLISHKEISNYIDQLPKAKVDGWRGVSERFRHIHLNNNFAQTYEIISTVIIKDRDKWEDFQDNNKARFDQLMSRYAEHAIFSDTDAKKKGTASFDQLYNVLTAPEYHIGIRSGVIPIYIAAVFHEFSEDIILQNDLGQLPLSADTLQMINACPEDYTLVFLEWNPEKQEFVSKLSEIFSNYVIEAEKNLSAYDFVASAMKRWYLSLPRYAKESKGIGDKESSKRYLKMVKLLKLNLNGHELLFEKLPEAFGYRDFNEGLAENIENAKNYYDGKIAELKVELIKQTKEIFSNAFYSMWNNVEPSLKVLEFPNISDVLIEKYRNKDPNFDIDHEQFKRRILAYGSILQGMSNSSGAQVGARIPADVELHEYQKEAIAAWVGENYRGIFDMATGTGKTYTGLGAISKLSEDLNDDLAVIIVAPYKHLVEQWVEDIVKFNMKPIIAYGDPAHKDWRKKFSKAITDQKIRRDKRFLCVVTTNVTFASPDFQERIDKIKSPILLVVDEAHNFGARSYAKHLDDRFAYRLALSATLERHRDDEGTALLYSFFGKKCIEYPLERAIDEDKLTPYKYYPILVYLSELELESYTGSFNRFSNGCRQI